MADSERIVLRAARRTWRANIFWGLLFGLLLLVPAFLAPAGTAMATRILTGLGGIGLIAIFGLLALRNRRRRIIYDGEALAFSDGLGWRRVGLEDLASVELRDIHRDVRAFELGDAPKFHTTGLDTTGTIEVHELRDREGRLIATLDRDLQPADSLARLLDLLRARIGSAAKES